MNKAFIGLLFIYGLFLYMFSFGVTKAYFTDTATSMNNTFTAAETFPSISPSPTPTNIADHLVISEVQIATPGASTSDFIELYNPTNVPVSLNNYRLVKRTGGVTDTSVKAFESTDSIPALGFYLWASSDGGYASQVHADKSTGENISSNDSVALRLGDLNTGTIIDAVGWGPQEGTPLIESTQFPSNPFATQSIERKALNTSTSSTLNGGIDENKGNGYDTNNNATDFVLRTTPEPQNSGSGTEQI